MSSKNFMSYEDATTVLGEFAEAIKSKQNAITAGIYIQKSEDTISVKRDIAYEADEVFFAEQTSNGLHVVVTVGSTTLYEENFVSSNPNHTVLDLVQTSFNVRAVRWVVTYLKASKTRSAGTEEIVWPSVTDTFVTTVDADKKLIIQSELDTALSGKQDTLTFDDVPTANSNNPVKSGGVKSAIDAAVSSAYHHAGTKTCVELVAGLLVAGNEGNVYNMTDSGTTTTDFIEGAGQPIKAGDNVGIAKISDGVYKFDLLSGFVDTTNFVQKSVTAGLLKNDGTVNDEIEGDISTLKSGLTTLDNEVNGDATTYPYADVITIEDAVPSNLADCSVKIEPVQDLHGQSAPYVGGAGKNKLPLTIDILKDINTAGTWNGNTYTINGGTFTVNEDTDGNVISITANGTFSSQGVFLCTYNYSASDAFIVKAGTYKFGCASPALSSTNRIRYRDSVGFFAVYDTIQTRTYESDSWVECSIVIEAGTVSNLVFQPMVYLSTETDATFAPYTNICPISGHTEASVQRDGVNRFDKNSPNIENKLFLNDGRVVGSSDWRASDFIKIDANKGYTLSGITIHPNTNTDNIRLFNEFKEDIGYSVVSTNSYPKTFPSGTKYIKFCCRNTEIDNAQFQEGVATPYVPYAGKTYTISLGDTIYGGTVDFDSGVMTVDRAILDLSTISDWSVLTDGRLTSNRIQSVVKAPDQTEVNVLCETYKPCSSRSLADDSTLIGIGINSGKLIVVRTPDGNAPQGGKLCYELATPFTVQLTPQQIQLLKGQNTLTASTGDISVTVNGVSGAIGSLTSDKQDKTDYALETTAKTVVGGINEVNSAFEGIDKGYYSRNVISGKWYKIADINATTWMIHNTIIAFNGNMLKHIVLRYDNDSRTFNNNLTKINSLNGLVGYVGIKFGTNSAEVYVKAGHIGISTYTVLTDGVEGTLNYHKPIETAYTDSDMDLIES